MLPQLKNYNKEIIWHPFTPQYDLKAAIKIHRGEGVYLIDENNKKYIDAISSWWVNLHGHCNQYISNKVSEQLFKLEHSIFSSFTHEPAQTLAERLLTHLPNNQEKIFFSDNGSTAVEVALKMALQFWHNKQDEKLIFIAFEDAYHGDTFGGMSVGARNVFNNAFSKLLFEVVHIPLPNTENFNAVKDLLTSLVSSHNVAGFIFEPLVQGAAGMKMYEAKYLDELIQIAKDNKVITIADEVMTGFGRTGRFLASDYLTNKPDIICLSKGLTGGYLPLGVTSCADFIYQAYCDKDKTKTFFHGHSYTGNPTACSAALASLDLLEKTDCWKQIQMIEEEHLKFKESLKSSCELTNKLKQIRTLGTIIAFELFPNTQASNQTGYLNTATEGISEFFLERGIIIRPLGNIFYVIPPYIIDRSQLRDVYDVVKEYLNKL